MTDVDVLIVGAGPAGLAAAEAASDAGARVLVAEQMPSVGRKFLMAGKSGLNITKDTDLAGLMSAIDEPRMEPMLAAFDAARVKSWAEGLGQSVFTGSSGRVFPHAMKASPLLRAWLARLADRGVAFRTRWTWEGDGFATPGGPVPVKARTTVLAMGGASWARLGSDGRWRAVLDAWGIPTEPFAPANMGFNVTWSDHMTRWFGHPVKGVTLHAGDLSVPGEFVISRSGVEGSAIYAVSKALREGAPLTVDLRPGVALSDLRDRWAGMPRKLTATARLKRLGLSGVQIVLVQEFARPLSADPAPVIKALPIPHTGPRPMDEAISTAGGVRWDALDDSLMLHARPGVFCAGEMLDWEAPTGGYLITGCLATGAWAGAAAARYAA